MVRSFKVWLQSSFFLVVCPVFKNMVFWYLKIHWAAEIKMQLRTKWNSLSDLKSLHNLFFWFNEIFWPTYIATTVNWTMAQWIFPIKSVREIEKWDLVVQKMSFFQIHQFSIFLTKTLRIDPWVHRKNWKRASMWLKKGLFIAKYAFLVLWISEQFAFWIHM